MACSFARCSNPVCAFTARQLFRSSLSLGHPPSCNQFPTEFSSGPQVQLAPHEPAELWSQLQPVAAALADYRGSELAQLELSEHPEARRSPVLSLRVQAARVRRPTRAEVEALEAGTAVPLTDPGTHDWLVARRRLRRPSVPAGADCVALRLREEVGQAHWAGALGPSRGCPQCPGDCQRARWREAWLPAARDALGETRALLCAGERRGRWLAWVQVTARRWGWRREEVTFDLSAELRAL